MTAISIQTARDGNPIPHWDGYQLHSLYDPIKEGNGFAEQFLSTIDNNQKPLLVLGLGFGYHILPLIDRFDTIYIAESNLELIRQARSIELLRPIFVKCQIICDLNSPPYIPDFYAYTLRSELRFNEKFFNDLVALVKILDKQTTISKNQLRVLINSPIYGGSATTARYVEVALKSIGVCTHFTDFSDANSLLQRYLLNPIKNASHISQLTDLLSETLWSEIIEFRPHIVFFNAQSPLNQKLMQAISSAGIISLYWFVEDFRRMRYWTEVCNDFDYFFMIQKGEFEGILEKRCHRNWGWFPVAASLYDHKKIELSANDRDFYGSDISFMGAAYPNRVRFFQQLPAELQRAANMKLWGTGWSDIEMTGWSIPLGERRIISEQSNIIYQATKVNINLHSANDSTLFDPIGDFVNPRTFEIALCGGFQLCDYRPAVAELFEPDTEMIYFSSLAEAVDKARYYLTHDNSRDKIVERTREKVLKFHTYDIRMTNMLDTIIRLSPSLTAHVNEEHQKLEKFKATINNPDFSNFIDKIDPAIRSSYMHVMEKIKSSDGTSISDYEAFLMLLDTFCRGE
jgi:spore maturation protein CgeB